MAAKKKAGRSKGKVTINFSGVESGGRKCPDGTYTAEITEAELTQSSNDNPMIAAKFKISKGKFKGTTLFDNLSLVPAALWKLRTLLEVVGIDPQEEDIPAEDYAEELIGQELEIVVQNETYEGEQRPKITAYGGADEEGEEESEDKDEEEDDEEEEPKVRNKKPVKGKAGKGKDDEDEEAEEEDAESEEDGEEGTDEEESEEEDEDDKPARGKKAAKSKVKEGSRVKFDDGEGNIVKGTVTSLDDGTATVEDKAGDEYEVDVDALTVL